MIRLIVFFFEVKVHLLVLTEVKNKGVFGHTSNLEGIIHARKKLANSFAESSCHCETNHLCQLLLIFLSPSPLSQPLKQSFSQSHHPWLIKSSPVSPATFNRTMAERPNKAAAAAGIGVRKLKIFPHASSLASIESLSLPLVSAFSLYLRRF